MASSSTSGPNISSGGGGDKPIPKHLQDLQTFLAKTISEVGRAVVKSNDDDLSQMHEDDFYLHLFMYQYFKKKSIEQKKVDAIAISHSTALVLIHKVLLPNLVGGPSGKKYAVLDHATAAKTDYFPLLPQRTLRELLGGQQVVLDALAEVVEVCNHIDVLQGHKKAGFGVVNLVHFVAIALTLVPTDGVADMLAIVVDDADIPIPIKYKLVYVWSLLDTANAAVLQSVLDTLMQQATGTGGYSFIDVTALPPMTMNGPSPVPTNTPAAATSSAPSTRAGAPPMGQHEAEEPSLAAEGARAVPSSGGEPFAGPAMAGPRVVYHGEDEDGGDGATQVPAAAPSKQPGGEDDFWAQLAS